MAAQQAAAGDRDETQPEQAHAMGQRRRRNRNRDRERGEYRDALTDHDERLRKRIVRRRRRLAFARDDARFRPERRDEHGPETQGVGPGEDEEPRHLEVDECPGRPL